MNELTDQQNEFLARYGFDEELFRSWQKGVADGSKSTANNAVTSELLAPEPGSIDNLPAGSSKAHAELVERGRGAIARGELGVVILNGGMATRFGGVVKGVVPVLGEHRSFLGLGIEDVLGVERECGGRVPVFLMNSFATDDKRRALRAARRLRRRSGAHHPLHAVRGAAHGSEG